MNFSRAIRLVFEGVDVEPITDLRVAFNVDKSDGEQLNRGVITIYNLNPSSRAALSTARPLNTILVEPVIKCFLYAGYDGNLKEIIAGDIFISHSQRSGEDWITTIELYSGITSASFADVTVSYDGKTGAKFISDQLLAPLGLSVDYTEDALQILQGKTYSDFSESGMSIRSATVFLNRFDLGFTIEENEKGLVYKLDSPRNAAEQRTEENSFNIKNGLVGSPVITRTGVEIVSLLRSEIELMQLIFVESQTINETLQQSEFLTNKYFVKAISHKGDTHSDDWFTSIEGFYADVADGVYDVATA